MTVVDLGDRLGIGARTIGPESRLVILKTNGELGQLRDLGLFTSEDKAGLLVDRIADVVNPSAKDIDAPPPNLKGVAREFLWGVCKTETDTIGILDTQAVLSIERKAEL